MSDWKKYENTVCGWMYDEESGAGTGDRAIYPLDRYAMILHARCVQ